jgi:hypothetical protein
MRRGMTDHAGPEDGADTARHPDSPRPTTVDEELNAETRPQMEKLGRAELDEQVGADEHEDLADTSSPGQNSDWLPQ